MQHHGAAPHVVSAASLLQRRKVDKDPLNCSMSGHVRRNGHCCHVCPSPVTLLGMPWSAEQVVCAGRAVALVFSGSSELRQLVLLASHEARD